MNIILFILALPFLALIFCLVYVLFMVLFGTVLLFTPFKVSSASNRKVKYAGHTRDKDYDHYLDDCTYFPDDYEDDLDDIEFEEEYAPYSPGFDLELSNPLYFEDELGLDDFDN